MGFTGEKRRIGASVGGLPTARARAALAAAITAASLTTAHAIHAREPAPAPQAPPAAASAPAEVTLDREAPFDHWCVAPLCRGQAQQQPSLLKLPPAITPNPSQGWLEQHLKRALTDAIESAVKATLGPAYNEAVADAAEALAATASSDGSRLDRVGGLGAAVLRAALTYRAQTVVPPDAACVGAARMNAVYEGLAISVALAPLEFPQKKGRVSAACVETARATARAVDAAVMAALVTDEIRREALAVEQAVEDAKKSCTKPVDDAQKDIAAAKSVAEVAKALHALRSRAVAPSTIVSSVPLPSAPPAGDAGAAPTASPGAPTVDAGASAGDASAGIAAASAAVDDACAKADDALRALDPAQLEALADDGLSDASLSALVVPFHAPPPAEMALIVRVAKGQMTPDDIRALVVELVEAAGVPVQAPVLKDAVEILPKAVVVQDGTPTVDPNAIVSFLMSKYDVDDDGKPNLRSLLGLQPTPWVFELNGGVPSVDFSQQKVVADASFGYATKKLGVVGRGWIDTYNIDDSQTHNDYTHAGGSVEGWWLSGDGTDKLHVEVRLSGAFDYYDTTTYPFQDALNHFYDFDSRMGRGTAFVGVRYGSPVDRVSLQLLAGGGAQYEDPDTTKFTGGQYVSLTSDQNLTAQASGRLLVRVHIVPQILGARLRGESTYFSITREQLAVAGSGAGLSTTSTVEQQQQVEVHGRLFLDADVASVAGFVPAVFGGLDYIGIAGSATSASALIPLLGAGIVRQSW